MGELGAEIHRELALAAEHFREIRGVGVAQLARPFADGKARVGALALFKQILNA